MDAAQHSQCSMLFVDIFWTECRKTLLSIYYKPGTSRVQCECSGPTCDRWSAGTMGRVDMDTAQTDAADNCSHRPGCK